jgi:hypothetical protein
MHHFMEETSETRKSSDWNPQNLGRQAGGPHRVARPGIALLGHGGRLGRGPFI